jgi:prepilin-type N-terminal cleavage/methylation domain-containing protein
MQTKQTAGAAGVSLSFRMRRLSKGSAFTLIEIMIVVAILSLLAVLAIPNAIRARDTAARNSCIANLRALAGAKEQWAFELRKGPDAVPDEAEIYGAQRYIREKPRCASDGLYELNAMRDSPTCTKDDVGHILTN